MLVPQEKTFDVAIVGAGPAGLIVAAWMAIANVKTILIDKNASPPPYGHADGLEQRSFEILDAFHLGHDIWQSAHKTIQVAYWKSIDHTLSRQFITQNSSQSSAYSSSYCEATLAQGRIEERLIAFLRQHENVEILRNHYPIDMHVSHDLECDVKAKYPVHLHIEKMRTHVATPETAFVAKGDHGMHIRSRYLLGSDGAHSWVRKRLGLEMQGEATQDHWGVLDCVPITDFPDIRKRCIIHSPAGNAMIIPRERRLVRFYVELCRRPDEGEKYGAEEILGKIVEMLKPYHFSTQIVEWESTYSVGRRLCMGLSTRDVVFLAGDAIHTHSPKAGQGMNTSMQDAFNLGWKLAYVVRGMASSKILHTYQQERAPIAERLLKFDEEIYNAISDKCHGNDTSGLLATLAKENTSASGLSIEYGSNLLVSDTPHLSSVFLKLGSRLPDLHVLNHSDGHTWSVHSLLNVSGSWSLLIFGADLADKGQMQRLQTLATKLSMQHSTIQRINRRSKQLSFGGIRPYLIYSTIKDGVNLHKVSSLFFPNEGALGFAYDRIFADPADATVLKQGEMNLHQTLGISRAGGMILIRPDHHIAFGGTLEEDLALDDFLLRFWLLE